MASLNSTNLERAVEAMLAGDDSLTPESIRAWIDRIRVAPTFDVSDEEAEALARRLETRHQITMTLGSALLAKTYQPWLESRRAQIEFYYWDRYRKLLEQKMFPKQVITTVHADTDRTLGYLQDPTRDGPWLRRGMVVGHVQSGKTSNYAGLVCKAADAGYKLIIVIAGVHNNLRNQTQRRIDEGFVGRDSAVLISSRKKNVWVGVGKIDPSRRPTTFTNSVRDFNKQLATSVGVPLQNLAEPAVFVIKKSAITLQNLLDWLRQNNAARGGRSIDAPMLLIDDEADNASINVNYEKGGTTRINSLIREILNVFSRSSYVGYTATPFANIFIDPDTDDAMLGEDLFPHDFIVSLDPPSNYFGPGKVFGSSSAQVIRHIVDSEVLPLSHKIDHVVQNLPNSLVTAVRAFVLARAIRLVRGDGKAHMSMLINASRFTNVQGQIRALVQQIVDDIQVACRLYAALPTEKAMQNPDLHRLREVWSAEYLPNATSWDQVQQRLHEASASIKVTEVNIRSAGTLNYEDYETGLSVIAIGGYSLSRGLTLEGLMVSYFLRNSMMYDTLMQMGRWFGYRPNYEDLCRVWMPEEAEGWYSHITESIEELREELRTMAAANATPAEFGLKVRAHPDTLIVTARNKMGAGEQHVVEVGLGNHFIETWMLRRDDESLQANREAVRQLAKTMRDAGAKESREGNHWLVKNVTVSSIRSFLKAFRNHPDALLTSTEPVIRYIDDRAQTELAIWDVLVPNVGNKAYLQDHETFSFTVGCQERTIGNHSDERTILISDKQRVASRGMERIGVHPEAAARAEAGFRERENISPNGKVNFPDRIYRVVRERPLLMIHLLDVISRDDGADNKRPFDKPIVAWSISFPATHIPEKRVQYMVTATWLKEHLRDESIDEEQEVDDS